MHSEATDIAPKEAVAVKENLRVLIAAGGTGGHVYPAIAIADAIIEIAPEAEIKFVGTKTHMEWEAVPRAGYDIDSIWISGFHRRLTLKNLLFPIKLATSILQSYNIISAFKPDAMISCGGYVAGPVGWTAVRKGVPLFIQEQNSYPGVTNRMLAKNAIAIFTAFEDADQYFPEGKTNLAGNPTRKTLTEADIDEAYNHFGFSQNRKTLLVLGGSGGARNINEAMEKHLETLHDELGLQIIWQCGDRYYDNLTNSINTKRFDRLILTNFLHQMPMAYAVADLTVSRAGALSCSELALTGKPSILVPSPNVAGDHQTKNAESMANEGAAKIAEDHTIKETLADLIDQVMNDQNQLQQMQQAALKLARPEAANTIAKEIIKSISSKNE